MPRSRLWHKHHHHSQVHHVDSKAKHSAAFILAVIAAMLGLAVAFFTQGADVLWMLIGAVAGALIGYLVGHSMDKAVEENK